MRAQRADFFVKDGVCDSLLTPSSRVLNAVIITKIKYKFLLSRLGPRRDRRPTQPRYGAEGSLDHLGDIPCGVQISGVNDKLDSSLYYVYLYTLS